MSGPNPPSRSPAGPALPGGTPGTLELRWTYVLFMLLITLDLLLVARLVNRLSDPGFTFPPDAPLLAVLLLSLQLLLGWLYFRLRSVIRYYRLLKDSYEQELDFSRQLMDASGQGMAILDEHGRFVYVNRRVTELLGQPAGELLGHTLMEYTLPEDQTALAAQYEARWQGETSRYALRIRNAGGETRALSLYGSPRWYRGRIVGTLLAVSAGDSQDA